MPQSILDACSQMQKTVVARGTELLKQGTQSGTLYVLLSGTIEILRGGVVVASTSEPGALFGEMSILLGTPHTASVRAKTQCEVYSFENGADFVRSNPDITFEIATLLAKRLSQATDYLTELNDSVRSAGNIWAW
ncbi:MAG: cyclic nucleotide-binding domain-containing protein [Aestuariivirga sp.]